MTAGTIPSNAQRRLQPLRKPRSPAFFRLSASKAGYNPWFRTVVSKSGPPRFDRKTKASELGAGYVSKTASGFQSPSGLRIANMDSSIGRNIFAFAYLRVGL